MHLHEYMSRYHSLESEEALGRIPFRKEYLLKQIGRGKKVLDVGCLGGLTSRLIQDQRNEVWAVELNATAAETARKRGVRVEVADVEKGLPFDDDFFDVVNAGEVLEHLYDTQFFFEEVSRVLKPGGFFIFTTPNLNSLENRWSVVKGGYLSMAGAYPEDHFGSSVRVFNLPKLRELCGRTGFSIDEVRGVFSLAPKGKWFDRIHPVASKWVPGLSKLLIVRATKRATKKK